MADPELVDPIVAGLLEADPLRAVQRERAAQGLTALLEPGEHWTQSCDQLHRAIEGALWDAALDEEVVDDTRCLIRPERTHGRSGRLASHAADLLDPDHGLEMDPYLRRLLTNRIFDRESHHVRHGRSTADTRRFALESALALLGWLDRISEAPWAVPALAARINAFEARDNSDNTADREVASVPRPAMLADLVPEGRKGQGSPGEQRSPSPPKSDGGRSSS